MTSETKVGMFVVLCIILALGLSAMMGNIHLFGKSSINVTFLVTNAAGLVPKSKVKFMGIQVGQVMSIDLENGMVHIRTAIEPDANIPDNVTVVLAQDGLMGEKFIDLSLKSHTPAKGYLSDGQIYSNFARPMTLEDLTEVISDIAGDIKKLSSSLSEVFGSEQGKQSMHEILDNIRDSSDSLKYILGNNKDNITITVANLRETTDVINRLAKSKEKDLGEIIASIKGITTRLDRLLQSEEGNIKDTISNIKHLSADAKKTVDKINLIADDARAGKGTLGMLLSDNETRDKLKTAINTLSNMADKADKVVLKVETGIERLTRHDKYHGYFNIKIIPSKKRYYLFGVSNKPFSGYKEKFTDYRIDDKTDPSRNTRYTEYEDIYVKNQLAFSLQYALNPYEWFTLRGGLFENTIGFGLDVFPLLDDNLTFTYEISDFFRKREGPYQKANIKYRFYDYFFLQAGWDDFASPRFNSFTFGGGIQLIDDDLKYVIGSVPVGAITK